VAAASEESFDVAVWRTAGKALDASDFTTRPGIALHLEALDHRAHPGPALTALAAELAASDDPQELVLITSEDVLGDLEFLAALAKLPLPQLFLATVSREGRYRLQVRSPAGMRLLKEASFDLEDVLSGRPKSAPPLKAKHGREALPAIFRQELFPLLLSAGVHPERSFHLGRYVYCLPRDGRLLRWSSPDRGAEQIAEGLPTGHVHWVDPRTHQASFVVGPLRKTGLHLVTVTQDLDELHHSCDIMPLHLQYEHPRAVAGYGGAIFVIYQKVCEAFDAATGRRLGERSLEPGMSWARGRFFMHKGSKRTTWHGLVWQGQGMGLRLMDIDIVPQDPDASLDFVALIDAPNPIFINANSQILTAAGDVWQFGGKGYVPGKVLAVSRTGRFFVYQGELRHDPHPVLVDLEKKTMTPYWAPSGAYLEPLLGQFARPRTLRHRFRRIGVDAKLGALVLFSASGEAWPIYCPAGGTKILLPRKPTPGVQCRERIDFEPLEGIESPYNLQIARWPDGSQAVLDGRGLLHLRSAGRKTECTIVLTDGETAGWVSDGRMWGPKYFLGERPADAADKLWFEAVHNTFLAPLL
jgi:hypothetical protein